MRKIYRCKLSDKNGQITVVEKEGNSEEEIRNTFLGTAYIPIEIKQKKSNTKIKSKKNSKNVLEFTQIMEQLLNAGLSIKDSLEVSSSINKSKKNTDYISKNLLEKINKGNTFASAVDEMDTVFSSVYRGIIAVGDKIGSVEKIFPRLRLYLETQKKISDKLSGALLYPIVVLITALFVFVGMLLFIFPRLKAMFSDFGGEAALLLEQNISKLENGFLIFVILLFLVVFFFLIFSILAKRNQDIQKIRDSILLKIPLLGKFFIYFETLNFTFAMETLLAGGIAIEDAIEESKTVVSNLNYKNALDDIKKRLTRGESLSSSFALHHSLFPDYMIKWMVVGEKSGKSDVIFSQLRNYFQNEIDLYTTKFMTLVEPTLIIIVGILLITLIINVIVPVFSLYGSLI